MPIPSHLIECLKYKCFSEGSSSPGGGDGSGEGSGCCNETITLEIVGTDIQVTVTQSDGSNVSDSLPLADLIGCDEIVSCLEEAGLIDTDDEGNPVPPAVDCGQVVQCLIDEGLIDTDDDGNPTPPGLSCDDVVQCLADEGLVELDDDGNPVFDDLPMPDHVCVDDVACGPSFPLGVAPPAAALAELPNPVIQGSTATVNYEHYQVTWSLGSEGWCSQVVKNPCPAPCVLVDDSMPRNPVPNDITAILAADGQPIVVPNVPPGCAIKVQWRDGWQEYTRGGDCSTDTLECEYHDSDPLAFVDKFVPNSSCDGGTANISGKWGGDGSRDFEAVVLSTGGADVYSNETPIGALPPYDSALSGATFSQLPESGDAICHRIYRWVDPGPAPATMDVDNASGFVLASEQCITVCRPSVGCDEDCDGEIDVEVEFPLGDEVLPKMATLADGSSVMLQTPADFETLISTHYPGVEVTNCGLFGCVPAGSDCPDDVVLQPMPCPSVTVPQQMVDGEAINTECGERGPLTVCGSSVDTCSPSKWESQIQVADDGVTWENADSFGGGEAWAIVGQEPRCVTFLERPFPEVPLAPGAYIREQVRCISDPGILVEDVKRAGTPVVSASPGLSTLSNGTPDTDHPCYDPANDRYNVRVTYLHSDGALYSVKVDDVDPAVGSAVIFNDAFADSLGFRIQAGGTVTWDSTLTPGTVQVDLWVTHNYVCPESSCQESGASITVGGSANCALDVSRMLLGGSSITAPGTAVETVPAHGGNFLLCVYNTADPTTPVVQYGAGTENPSNNAANLAAGVYPADSNSTYPLVHVPGGEYLVVIKHNGIVSVCGCLPVEEWNLCSQPAFINYEGLTTSGQFCFDLPVTSNMSEIEFAFETGAQVTDELEIFYDGVSLPAGATGQVLTSGMAITGTVPFTYVPGVDTIQVCVTPDDPANHPPNTITVFELAIGCCDASNVSCEIPHRDPYAMNMGNNGCSIGFSGYGGFEDGNGTNFSGGQALVDLCWRTDLTRVQPDGCVLSATEVQEGFGVIAVGSEPSSFLVRNYCIGGAPPFELGLPANRTVTQTAGTVTICFSDPAAQTRFTAMLTELDAVWTATGSLFLSRVLFFQGWDVNCGSDGGTTTDRRIAWQSGLWTTTGNCITIDYNNMTVPPDPCHEPESGGATPNFYAQQFQFAIMGVARFDLIHVWGEIETKPRTGTVEISPGVYQGIFDYGIVKSPCTNYTPVGPYKYIIDNSTNPTTFRIERPDGTVAFDSKHLPWVGQTVPYFYAGFWQSADGINDRCSTPGPQIPAFIGIRDTDGNILQEDGNGGPELQAGHVIDLQFYGGSPNYVYVDGPTLVADFLALPSVAATGVQAAWMPVSGSIWFNPPLINAIDLKCV